MAIEKKMIPVAPWRGLYLDGVTVPGGLSKAENIIILPDGTAERRPYERTLTDAITTQAGRGLKSCYELLKSDGTRYIFADVDGSETTTTAFGAEKVSAIAGWTPTSGWTWDAVNLEWDHASGTTALVASMATAIEAAKVYRVVVDVTCPTIYGSGSNWTYTHADSGFDWTTKEGNTKTVWLNKWTHSAGSTIALNASKDFTPEIGASYVVVLHVTHTSGTSLTVYLGGITAGTITSSGYHTFIVRFCTDTTGLRLVPTSNWEGSINKTSVRVPNLLDNWCSVVKLVDPAGPNTPSNYDYTASLHTPKSVYKDGAELLYIEPTRWYVEAASSLSQSLALTVGATAAGTITESGIYSYDVTATATTAPTFTPTTSWTGSINSLSVQEMTQSASSTYTKVMAGEVTGTEEYEITWTDILTDLEAGDTILPQWTTLQDRAFRVDGVNKNYWFGDASGYHTLGCPAPTDAPTTSNASGGELLAGTYNVYYTYCKKYDDGYVVEGNPSPASNTVVSNDAISVNVVACTEDDVNYIRVYRTLFGEPGSSAYYCGEWVNETQTITLTGDDDTIRDTLSTLEFDHDMPPIGKFVLGAGSRLWLIDADGTLHWSKLDSPEIMSSSNYTTFDPKDGFEVTGMCAQKSTILVFKRNKVWSIDLFSSSVNDDGTAALARNVVSTKVGCIAPGSIQTVGNESAIWLSEAGFIFYNGGNIKNISSGGVDSEGNPAPSRLHGVIDSFIEGGALPFVSSVYHTTRHLYHVNFITRSDDGTEITAQRHFVYNLDTDTWTEYAFYNNDHEKQYEISFILAHDSVGREILLTPYLSTTTGTSTNIYQINYDIGAVAAVDASEWGSAEGGALCYLFVDSSDNVYGINEYGGITKTTPLGVQTDIATLVQLEAALEAVHGDCIDRWDFDGDAGVHVVHALFDETNECFYLKFKYRKTLVTPALSSFIMRVTFAGAITIIKDPVSITGFPDFWRPTDCGSMVLNEDGDTLFTCELGVLYKITGLDGTPSSSVYYTFTGYETTLSCLGMGVYGDNLYMHYIPADAYWDGYDYDEIPEGAETHRLGKFTDITGDASFESWLLASERAYAPGMLVLSDLELYLYEYPGADDVAEANPSPYYFDLVYQGQIYKMSYEGGGWTQTNVGDMPVFIARRAPARIIQNSSGLFYYIVMRDDIDGEQQIDYGNNMAYIYDGNWTHLGEVELKLDTLYGYGEFGPLALGRSSVSEESAVYFAIYDAGA